MGSGHRRARAETQQKLACEAASSAASRLSVAAHGAHIGGFVFGLAAIRLFATRVKDLPFGGAKYPVY